VEKVEKELEPEQILPQDSAARRPGTNNFTFA